MKSGVFIVGPEASGKTVLATMMLHAMDKNPEIGITFNEKDFRTKLYFQNMLTTLREKEWPASTKGDEVFSLSWEWRIKDKILADVNLVDAPGQNIRDELVNKSNTLGIVNRIKEASIIIVVVDLIGHYDTRDVSKENILKKKNGNAFIIEETLKMMTPDQSLYLVLSKADLLSRYLKRRSDWVDKKVLFPIIQELMPEFNAKHNKSKFDQENWKMFAVSAVETISNPNGDLPPRIPKIPLTSYGMPELLKSLAQSIELDREVDCPKMGVHLNHQGEIQCKECEGRGHLNDGFISGTPCPTCNGKKVSLCVICEGKKKIQEKRLKRWWCREFHLNLQAEVSCTQCQGKGHQNNGFLSHTQCPLCKGTRKILCLNCQGKS